MSNKIDETLEQAVILLLEGIGVDLSNPGVADTPKRFVKALKSFSPNKEEPEVTMFPSESKGVVTIKNLELRSLCVPHYQIINAVGKKKRARDIKIGDKLWTLHNGIPTQTTVKSIQERKSNDVLKLTFSNGKTIALTGDHPLKTKLGWVEAKDSLREKIEYVNPRTFCKKQHELNVGYSLGYSLAVIMADGAIENLRTICVRKKSKDVMDKFSKAMFDTFGISNELVEINYPSGFTGKNVHQWQYRLTSSQITKRIIKMMKLPEDFAGGNKTFIFKLPDIVKNNSEVLSGFIEGYLDTDGYRYNGKKKYKRIFSSNKVFMDEFSKLLNQTYHNNGESSYAMNIPKNIEWLVKHGFDKNDESIDLGESKFIEVVSIEALPSAKVYSFSCSDINTFCVGGFLTHNCQHHLFPFFGSCSVAYIPNGYIAGLSKFQRVLDFFAERPQDQENITHQVLEYLVAHIQPKAMVVMCKATHTCMTVRGVKCHNGETITIESYGTDIGDKIYENLLKSLQ